MARLTVWWPAVPLTPLRLRTSVMPSTDALAKSRAWLLGAVPSWTSRIVCTSSSGIWTMRNLGSSMVYIILSDLSFFWGCTLDIIHSLPLGKRSCWWARRTTDVIWQEYRIWGRNTSGWRLSLEHTSRPFRWGVTCNMVAYHSQKWKSLGSSESSFWMLTVVLWLAVCIRNWEEAVWWQHHWTGGDPAEAGPVCGALEGTERSGCCSVSTVFYYTTFISNFLITLKRLDQYVFFLTLTKILWLYILSRIGIWTFFGFLVFSGQRLEESLEYQQFVANVEEEEAWINEKLNLVGSEDYGDTLAAVQVWKNKPKLADYSLILDIPSYWCLFVF